MTKKRPPNQWQPGQTGNAKGRPPGQSEITRLRAAIAAHVPSILEQLVTAAKGGDVQASRLVLERILPPLKAVEQSVTLQLPEDGTLSGLGRSVLKCVAEGQLAPGQGAILLGSIGTLARVVEIDELATRVEALEKQHAKN